MTVFELSAKRKKNFGRQNIFPYEQRTSVLLAKTTAKVIFLSKTIFFFFYFFLLFSEFASAVFLKQQVTCR
jgi:hypothetical protein